MTKTEAIRKVLEDNNGVANWGIIYSEILKYYPDAQKSLQWQAGIRGVLYRDIKNGKNFKMINTGIISLSDYDISNQVLDEEKPFVTEKNIEILIRIGQNRFREKLLKKESSCPLTGISDKRLLTASHIKPWAISNNDERLDINNGFIFSPLIDKLFDKFLITFDKNKKLLVAPSLSRKNIEYCGLKPGTQYSKLSIETKLSYLDYHRTEFDRINRG